MTQQELFLPITANAKVRRAAAAYKAAKQGEPVVLKAISVRRGKCSTVTKVLYSDGTLEVSHES